MLKPVKTSCSLKLSTFFRVHDRNQMRFCHHHRSSLDFSKLLNSNTETPKPPLPLSPSFHLAACAPGIHRGLRKCEINCTKFMECVVQGIIETQHVEALEILLQGLCGVSKKNLRVHEICLKNGPNLGLVASEVRLICDIEQSEQTEPTWTIRHIGGAMRGAGAEQLSVLVRSVVESKTSKNVLRFFYALGYKLDHELLRVGFSFHFQRGTQINVTVSSVNKMLQLHDVDAAVPVTPGIQLVEVTAPATSENYAEVGAAVSSFSEYLAPLLHLSKPGTSTGVVPTAAAAAASLLSDGGGTTL